jgi:hypothetical protein
MTSSNSDPGGKLSALDADLIDDIVRDCTKLAVLMHKHQRSLTTGEFQVVLGVAGILEGIRVSFDYRLKREALHAERLKNS